MKDIMATQEAKCEATDAGERRHAKVTGRARILFLLAALAATASLPATAVAQQWVDPEGYFTLNHGSNWQLVQTGSLTTNPEVLAIFASVIPPERRLCNVRRQIFRAPAEVDQGAANRWLQIFTTPPPEAFNPSFDDVDGVSFINYDMAGGEFSGRYRAFALPAGLGVRRTEFLCATRSPATPDDEAAIASFLGGIELTPAAAVTGSDQ